jgi:murein DD-endopeptidase MepM/ murein hydrolase activator NlpD
VLKRLRFFYFSDKTLGFHEVRFFVAKTIGSAMLLGIGMFGVLFFLNYALGDPLGMTTTSELVAENRYLKNQIRELNKKAQAVQKTIDELAERNNQLRLLVDLGKIDGDTKQAAVGGALSSASFPFLTPETGALLASSSDLLSRLEREVELQKKSYEEIAKRYEYNKTFFMHLPAIKPCAGEYSLRGYGMRIHPVLGVWRMHEGLDIITDVGTPVYATGDGTVSFAGRTASGYGAVVEIDHGYGYTTLYAHLSQVRVRSGQKVKRGELIARSGRSGLVSGPHLHYEVRLNGRKLNPVDFFFDDIDAARYRAQLASSQ